MLISLFQSIKVTFLSTPRHSHPDQNVLHPFFFFIFLWLIPALEFFVFKFCSICHVEPGFGTPGGPGPVWRAGGLQPQRWEKAFCALVPFCARTYHSDWPVVSPPGTPIPVLMEGEMRRPPLEGAGGRCSASSLTCVCLPCDTWSARWSWHLDSSKWRHQYWGLKDCPSPQHFWPHQEFLPRPWSQQDWTTLCLTTTQQAGQCRAGLSLPPTSGCPLRRACGSLSEEEGPYAAKLTKGYLFMFGRGVWGGGHS